MTGQAFGELRVETRGLAVGYGATRVVEDVNLGVHAGQIVTLIGPNGAGKSTILRTVAGQLKSQAGSIVLCGRPLEQVSDHDRALLLSVMLTERLRTELMSCWDVVGSGRYPHTGRLGVLTAADRDKVREAMELVGVWELRDHDFMRLSDGQRQRILLARAICQEPQVMVLDEPTAYLDVHYQIELLDVLRHLVATNGVAIVMTLHELSLAREVSDCVVCVKDGRVAFEGAPSEVFVPQVIDELYDLQPGTYDARTGAVRLAAHTVPSSRHEGGAHA